MVSTAGRAPLLWMLVPWVLGSAWGEASARPLPVGLLVAVGTACAIGALLAARWFLGWAVMVVTALFLVAAARCELARNRLPEWERLPPREARLDVRVDRLFAPGDKPLRVSGLGTISHAPAHLADLVGQRVFFSYNRRHHGEARPIRSAHLRGTGLLAPVPREDENAGDSFNAFLRANGVNFSFKRGRQWQEVRPARAYDRFCVRALARLIHLANYGLEGHPSLAAVLQGMLLGQAQDLTEEQDARFTQSGTLHLFSISGLHIGVIAAVLESLLALSRAPHWTRYGCLLMLVWLFVDVTGRAPSAVRAFAMIALVQGAFVLRAPASILSALVVSAWIVLLVDPLQIFTAGFQMSYGIVAAIILFGLPLSERWTTRCEPFRHLPRVSWNRFHKTVRGALHRSLSAIAIGVSATLVGTLAGLMYFQLLTPVSFFANLLMIPVASLALIAGFAALMVGLLGATELTLLFNQGAAFLIWLMEHFITAAVALPGAHYPAHFSSSLVAGLALLGLFALLLLGAARHWQGRLGSPWLPVVYTVAVVGLLAQWG